MTPGHRRAPSRPGRCFGAGSEHTQASEPAETLSETGDSKYSERIEDMLRFWILEDMAIVVAVCGVDPSALAEDVARSILSDEPKLHRADADYARCVAELVEWFLGDLSAFTVSFDVDIAAAFQDVLAALSSDWGEIGDHMLKVVAESVGGATNEQRAEGDGTPGARARPRTPSPTG